MESFLWHKQLNYDITAILQIWANTYVNPAELGTNQSRFPWLTFCHRKELVRVCRIIRSLCRHNFEHKAISGESGRQIDRQTDMFLFYAGVIPPGGGGVLPEKLGEGLRLASQNPYPVYDQNLRYSLPYLWLNKNSKPNLWSDPHIKILFQTCILISSVVQTNFKLPQT